MSDDQVNIKRDFWTQENAAAFQHPKVAAAYQYRPTYSPEAFAKLAELMVDAPRNVLDLGCGTGALARNMVAFADHVDAVDISAAMIEQGKQMPHGDDPKLTWHVGRAEDVSSDVPFALVTTGDSLHWMDWDVLMPRLNTLLSPNGLLVICLIESVPHPWDEPMRDLFRAYSVVRGYSEPDLVHELETRDLFTVRGRHDTTPVPFVQTIEDYVESFHARSGLAHGRMEPAQSAAFDNALRELLAQFGVTQVETQVYVQMIWGMPHGNV